MAVDEDRRKEKMTALAETFPCMRGVPGVDPWEPEELNRWAAGPASSGEKQVVRFLLSVWNRYEEWECGRFDAMEALLVWDAENRKAFATWAADPWWA
jgi:hypothetical protein